MSGRVSTSGFHFSALNAMLDAQARLAKTQAQVASGKRVNTPADDPVAATRIQDLTRQLAASQQFGRNADVAISRLSLEDQTLADVGSGLNRIRELLLEAGTATVDFESRQMIQAEIAGVSAELLDLANRRDAQGEYLFAGLSVLTQPFARAAGGAVQYFGDQGQRAQQVGPTQRIADGDSGVDVFGRIAEGNGTFVTSAAGINTGSGSISVGNVVDRSQWPGGTFTVQFTTSTTWQVLDSAVPMPNVVAGGAYEPGTAIVFAGASVQVSGAPAAGDAFIVRQAASTDLFSALDSLVDTLGERTDTPAQKAKFAMGVGGSLQQLDRALDHMLNVRARVGVRLNTLDRAVAAQQDTSINLDSLLSSVRDLDYAEAISRLNLQYTGLQAAQKSMASVGQLSLFDYL
jgi:flagellar hook-associated protein 3 FlgL